MNRSKDRFSQFLVIGIVSVVSLVIVAVLVYSNRASESSPEHINALSSLPRGIDSLTGLPYIGDPDAPLSIIIYEDLGCPNCRNFYTTVEADVMTEYVEEGKVRLMVYTLAFVNALSLPGAEGVTCAAEQDKFWEYRDTLFNNQGVNPFNRANLIQWADDLGMDTGAFSECFDLGIHSQAIIDRSQTAYEFGVTGTPTTEIAGVRYAGVLPYDSDEPVGIKQLLDAALENTGEN